MPWRMRTAIAAPTHHALQPRRVTLCSPDASRSAAPTRHALQPRRVTLCSPDASCSAAPTRHALQPRRVTLGSPDASNQQNSSLINCVTWHVCDVCIVHLIVSSNDFVEQRIDDCCAFICVQFDFPLVPETSWAKMPNALLNL